MRISGFGGQGIILAGVIMAKAAVEQDGIYETQTQSYGAESRGGACMANIVLSKEKIDYPEPEELDILVVCMEVGSTLEIKSQRQISIAEAFTVQRDGIMMNLSISFCLVSHLGIIITV